MHCLLRNDWLIIRQMLLFIIAVLFIEFVKSGVSEQFFSIFLFFSTHTGPMTSSRIAPDMQTLRTPDTKNNLYQMLLASSKHTQDSAKNSSFF